MFRLKFIQKKRLWLCIAVVLFVLVSFKNSTKNQTIGNAFEKKSVILVDIVSKTHIISEVDDRENSLKKSQQQLKLKKEHKEYHQIKVNISNALVQKKKIIAIKRFGYNKMTFDIELVTNSFSNCHEKNLNLADYVIGYSEIYNFFNVLGTVFGFIASDVKEKIDILENLRNDKSDENSSQYAEVESMMTYEIERNKQSDKELFGSRTLLRLHRALDFTRMFLEKLGEMEDSDKVSTVAKEVYHKTLGNFHPWLIRNAANLALYSLPSRKDLIKKIAPDGIDENVFKEKIVACTGKMHSVYSEIESLYTKYSLHKLP